MQRDPQGDPVVLAFDVGGTSVKAAAVDRTLHLLVSTSRPSVRGDGIIEVIADAAKELLDGLDPPQLSRVAGAGVVVPGIVDPDRGVAVRSVNLDLEALPLAEPLAERLGVPVRVGHDVQAAGEAVRRSAGAVDDPFVVIIGTGIAAVTYVGGRAVPGVSGQAGELGHVVVRPLGPLCACGNRGCLEAVASAGAVTRAYEERTGTRVDGAHVVVERVATDPVAADVWAEAVSALADGLLTVCALLAPGAIVLGGGLSEAGDALVVPLSELMRQRSHVAAVPPVAVTDLGGRAGLIGAALVALDAVN